MKNKSNILKSLNIIMLLSGTLTILIAFGDIIIKKFIELRYDIVVDSVEAQSVGIIGGADGPTSIFLTSTQGWTHKSIWMIAFLTIAFGCYFLKRKLRSQ